MASILSPSEEKSNGTRLSRLLVDGGTHVLLNYFHSIHPPSVLQSVLNTHQAMLLHLKKRKVLNDSQWNQLFPPIGAALHSETFDITLLVVLLRNICNLTAPSPNGWNQMPDVADTSKEANVVRIKCLRNTNHHSFTTGIPDVEFQVKWQELSSALIALGFDQKEIMRLENESIDHDTKARIQAEVQKWKDDNIEPRIQHLEQEVSSIQQSLAGENNCEITNCMPNEVDIFGRSTDINKVLKAMQDQVGIVVITGGPGFGKTTVAKKVCCELATNQDIKTAVMFCSFRFKNNISDVAMAMALVCSKNLSQPPEKPQPWLLNWTKQVKQHLTLVLDNADGILESDDRDEFVNMLSGMLSLSEYNINFVITSRKSFNNKNRDSKSLREVRLQTLSLEDAKTVLLSRVSIKENLTGTKMDTIAELCGCLPLALCIIGSLLSDYTEDQLIADLQQKPLAVLKEDESDSNSVEKAIKISFDRLNEEEQKCLVLMTVFCGSFNSEAARAVVTLLCKDEVHAIPILRSLKNRSLLEQPVPHRYEIHPLIQSYARQIGKTMYAELIDQGKMVACGHFMSCIAKNTNIYWSKDRCQEALANFNKDRANFELFLQEKQSFELLNDITIRTVSEVCQYLENCLPPSKQLKFLEDLLPFLTSGEKLKVLCLLSLEFRKRGDYAQYEIFLDEAKKYYKSSEMFDGDKVAKSFFLNFYARFLRYKKKDDEAKEYFSLALELCEELPDTAYVQKGMILLYAGREDEHHNQDQAVEKLTKALELLREKLGNHLLTMLLCSALAGCFLFKPEHCLGSQEDIVRSIALFKESLEILNNLGLKDQKESILSVTNLGICFQEQGKMDEAMELYQASLDIAERELDCDHKWKVMVLIQMADLCQESEKVDEARALKDSAMKMSDRLSLPDDNPYNKFLLQKIK